MLRKLTGGVICLCDIWPDTWGNKVSIFCNNKGIVVVPYRDGDEQKRNRIIKEFDSRRRICIPRKMLKRAGISTRTDAVFRTDGTLLLLPIPENMT